MLDPDLGLWFYFACSVVAFMIGTRMIYQFASRDFKDHDKADFVLTAFMAVTLGLAIAPFWPLVGLAIIFKDFLFEKGGK